MSAPQKNISSKLEKSFNEAQYLSRLKGLGILPGIEIIPGLVPFILKIVGGNKVEFVRYLNFLIFICLAFLTVGELGKITESFPYIFLINIFLGLLAVLSSTLSFKLTRHPKIINQNDPENHKELLDEIEALMEEHDITVMPEVGLIEPLSYASHKLSDLYLTGLTKKSFSIFISKDIIESYDKEEVKELIRLKLEELKAFTMQVNNFFRGTFNLAPYLLTADRLLYGKKSFDWSIVTIVLSLLQLCIFLYIVIQFILPNFSSYF